MKNKLWYRAIALLLVISMTGCAGGNSKKAKGDDVNTLAQNHVLPQMVAVGNELINGLL